MTYLFGTSVPTTGEDGFVRLRLPLHGVEDLHGVDNPLEDFGEGPLDQTF